MIELPLSHHVVMGAMRRRCTARGPFEAETMVKVAHVPESDLIQRALELLHDFALLPLLCPQPNHPLLSQSVFLALRYS